ncbi:MAG TPA: M23 family metallopeptidase [Hyphomicrobiaceae bacterium]|nr:M23 family metallopeptidase [Hyphomicrobiaceae bacterium]
MDTKRHAPLGRRRVHPGLAQPHGRRGGHGRGGVRGRHADGIFASDHADTRQGGRFRWLVSTCLAAAVGVLAILVVIAGSTDTRESNGSVLVSLERVRNAPVATLQPPSARVDGLRWATPKADRLLIPSGAMATKFVIFDAIKQRRGARDYIFNKPYARLVARLAPISKAEAQRVPAFNPFKLYANTTPIDQAETSDDDQQDAVVKIVELLGGSIPGEDGQELTSEEVAEVAGRALAAAEDPAQLRPGLADAGGPSDGLSRSQLEPFSPNTTILSKSVLEADDPTDDLAGREVRVVKAQRGDTLARLLLRLGAEPWQARAMTDAARNALPDGALQPNQELHVTLVPSIVRANRMEPVRLSVFGEGHDHKVTVNRNAAGEFVASASPIDERLINAQVADDEQPQASSLYASLHHTAERQGIPPETILQILKVHAYETDFRQRVRAGDGFEFFFDIKDEERGVEGNLGELLSTAITSAGETHRFYRFRTPDGTVDYYDDQGNTSRKFLMRRPVRGDDVRITSGFGVRRHPILQIPKMHTGVDWAAATGTPIMAAGSGVIEEAGRKGEYGNYIRIRHPNGYKTAYGHMARFAPGVGEGVKVRQGQIIGYVGSTGLASGPHVHFEVLVNSRFVDPMSIQVPRERRLDGRQLADFQKERARIDDLMRRNPVSARVATASQQQDQ